MQGFVRRIAGLFGNRDGSIALIGAMALSAVLGMAGFAVEGTQGYMAKVRNQRVADLAALGAALAYKSNPSNTIMIATAQTIARANGLPASSVNAVTATTPSGGPAVKVTVTTAVPLDLAKAISSKISYNVANTAMASLTSSSTAACITALSQSVSYGIVMTGGTKISATGCGVSTGAGISLESSSTTITAAQVTAGGGINRTASIITSPTPNNYSQNKVNAVSDPISSDARLIAAFNKLGTWTRPATPTAPPSIANPTTPAGADWDFSWSPNATVAAYRDSQYGSSYTVPAGNYTIGKLSVQGGITVKFTGGAGRTITIANGINQSGSSLTFGPGTYRINGDISQGSGTLSFGDGSYSIGSGAVSLGGTVSFGAGPLSWNQTLNISSGSYTFGAGPHSFAGLVLNNGVTFNLGAGDLNVTNAFTFGGGTLPVGNIKVGGALTVNSPTTFSNGSVDVGGAFNINSTVSKGAGAFTIAGSLVVSGGRTVDLGSGNVNIGGAITLEGGSTVRTGAGTQTIGGSNGVGISVQGGSTLRFGDGAFSVNGSVTTAGGSNLVFGVSPNHLINGALNLNGSSTFGAGMFTINGGFTNNTGGTMTGSGVTFVLAGTFTLSGGTSMTLSAPSSDAGGGITDILVATKSYAATSIGGGSQNSYTGLVYAPNSPLTFNGGANVGSSGCFMMIVSTISMNGGTSSGTACSSLASGGSGSSGSVALVQ